MALTNLDNLILFKNNKINTLEKLFPNPDILNLKYIFVDSSFYNEDFLEEIFLRTKNKNIKIFVLNCNENTKPDITHNTDYQNIKFLYRPLASSYIKALLRLYS